MFFNLKLSGKYERMHGSSWDPLLRQDETVVSLMQDILIVLLHLMKRHRVPSTYTKWQSFVVTMCSFTACSNFCWFGFGVISVIGGISLVV